MLYAQPSGELKFFSGAELASKTDGTNPTFGAANLPDGWDCPSSYLPPSTGSGHTGSLSWLFRGNNDAIGSIRELIKSPTFTSLTFPTTVAVHLLFPAGGFNNPTADKIIVDWSNGVDDDINLVWTKTGYLAWGVLLVKKDSIQITADKWMTCVLKTPWTGGGGGSDTAIIDGNLFARTVVHAGSNTTMNLYLGWSTISGNGSGTLTTFRGDDVLIYDASGSTLSNIPDTASTSGIVYLPVTADSSIGNWTGGAGGTSNLAQAFTLPVPGKTSELNTTNIKNSTASTSELYFGTTAAYNTKVSGGSTIRAIRALARTGEDATTGTAAGNVKLYTNPTNASATAFNFGNDLTAHLNDGNAYRDGLDLLWVTTFSAIMQLPSVTQSSGITVMLEKTTNSTKQGCVDQLGAMVMYSATPAGSVARIFNTSER